MRASQSYQLQERVLVTEYVWEKTSSITIGTFTLLLNCHGQFSRCKFSLLGRTFGLCLHTMMYIIIIIYYLWPYTKERTRTCQNSHRQICDVFPMVEQLTTV